MSLVYNSNPRDQASVPRSMARRKQKERLDIHCTAKGKISGNGGCTVAFMFGILYDSGVVLCEQYDGQLTGAKLAKMIKNYFPRH